MQRLSYGLKGCQYLWGHGAALGLACQSITNDAFPPGGGGGEVRSCAGFSVSQPHLHWIQATAFHEGCLNIW